MQLGVPDAARLFDTSEEQIYAWIDEGKIPFYEVNEQYRFHRAELLEWATANGKPVSVEIFQSYAASGGEANELSSAMLAGGVHHHVVATDRRSFVEAIVAHLPIADAEERRIIREVLLSRDHAPTTVGDGIAIPHVRHPIVLHGGRCAISLCFFEKPVDQVTTSFMLVTPNAKAHLRLLAELSAALFDPGFKAAVNRQASAEELLKEARRIEVLFERRSGGGR
jgi:nitrogen PTS system EIIA component